MISIKTKTGTFHSILAECSGVDPVEQTFILDEKSKCVMSIRDEPCHRYIQILLMLVFLILLVWAEE